MPVTKDEFEQMFSGIRHTIRNQVWEKAGVYLNEEIIVPLCDKWACTAHQFENVLQVGKEDSKECLKFLAESQNILSDNFIISDYGDHCDSQVILRDLKNYSHSSNMEM